MAGVTRSPPPQRQEASAVSSDSELSITPTKITHRKRLRPSDFSPADSLDAFKNELRDMLKDWKREQNKTLQDWMDGQESILKTITSDITDIKTQIKDIKNTNQEIDKSMNFMNSGFEDMRHKVEILEQDCQEQQSYIRTLEMKIEEMELVSIASCVEIRNVPIKQKETKEDLLEVLSKLHSAVDMTYDPSSIREIYRTRGKPGDDTARPIVADLSSCIQKKKLLTAVKQFNTTNKTNKLNSESLALPGARVPIFVGEHLTPRGRRLHFLARGIANTHQYKYCWTEGGRVYLRKTEGTRVILIDSEKQLEALKTT